MTTPTKKPDYQREPKERQFLHVRFLRGDHVEKERILEMRYACRAMEAWRSQGTQYRTQNHPFELPRAGVAAHVFASRRRATATRFLKEVA